MSATNKPTPSPLYSCADTTCASEVSYPARDLHWAPAMKGWYCFNCWEYFEPSELGEQGESLERYLTGKFVTIPRELSDEQWAALIELLNAFAYGGKSIHFYEDFLERFAKPNQ